MHAITRARKGFPLSLRERAGRFFHSHYARKHAACRRDLPEFLATIKKPALGRLQFIVELVSYEDPGSECTASHARPSSMRITFMVYTHKCFSGLWSGSSSMH